MRKSLLAIVTLLPIFLIAQSSDNPKENSNGIKMDRLEETTTTLRGGGGIPPSNIPNTFTDATHNVLQSPNTFPGIQSVVTYQGYSDVIGVYGHSFPEVAFGIGGRFDAGYIGLQGRVYPGSAGGTGAIVNNNSEGGNSTQTGLVVSVQNNTGTGTHYGIRTDVNGGPGSDRISIDSEGGLIRQNGYPIEINHEAGDSLSTAIYIRDSDGVSDYNGMVVDYGDPLTGFGIFGIPFAGGGFNVGTANGGPFAPISASAFNVSSDERLKHHITDLTSNNREHYIDDLKNLRTATYFYNREEGREVPHIGIIAQSAPVEILNKINSKANGSGEERLSVNLADWLGLVTVGMQHLLDENEALKERIEKLEAQVDSKE